MAFKQEKNIAIVEIRQGQQQEVNIVLQNIELEVGEPQDLGKLYWGALKVREKKADFLLIAMRSYRRFLFICLFLKRKVT